MFITHIYIVFTLNSMQKNISLVTFSIFFNANNTGSAYQNRKKGQHMNVKMHIF